MCLTALDLSNAFEILEYNLSIAEIVDIFFQKKKGKIMAP